MKRKSRTQSFLHMKRKSRKPKYASAVYIKNTPGVEALKAMLLSKKEANNEKLPKTSKRNNP